jgi:hypothetical protein
MTRPRQAEIHWNENGLAVSNADSTQPSALLEWAEVDAVLGYKRDLYTMDMICLGFVTHRGTIEVHEEMNGWTSLVEELPSLLPGMHPFSQWWESVAKPPFAPSVKTLYERR